MLNDYAEPGNREDLVRPIPHLAHPRTALEQHLPIHRTHLNPPDQTHLERSSRTMFGRRRAAVQRLQTAA